MSTASSASVLHPSLLPFSILSYDGSKSEDEDDFPISNVLSPDPSLFHCSRSGRNFDLVLQYTPSLTSPSSTCTITHVVIHGPSSCTAPIRTGILFSSLDPPPLPSYSPTYNDLTRADYEQLPPSTLRSHGALAYFTCTDVDHLQTAITLPSWSTPTRFLHLKLLSALGQLDDNIDIARIAVVGYPSSLTPSPEVPLGVGVLAQLGLVRQELGAWNRVATDHIRVLMERPCCVLWVGDPFGVEGTRARTALHEVATSGVYDDRLTFFYWDQSGEEKDFARQVAASAGVLLEGGGEGAGHGQEHEDGGGEGRRDAKAREDAKCGLVPCGSYRVVITDFNGDVRYHYAGELDDAALRAWLDAYVAGTLTPWRRSETLPAVNPAQPGLTQLTANSFDQLVLHSPHDVLVYSYGQEPGADSALVQRSLRAVAAALQGVEQVKVATLNAARNDLPPQLTLRGYPEGRPAVWLFGGEGGKEQPRLLDESLAPSSLLRFLHAHMKEPRFDLPAALSSCREVEEEVQRSFAAAAVVQRAVRVLGRVKGWLKPEEAEELKGEMDKAVLAADEGDQALMQQASARLQAFLDEWEPSYGVLAQAQEAMMEFTRKAAGKDGLTEDEMRQVGAAMADLTQHLPPDKDDDDEEEDEEEEEEEEDGEDGGDGLAVSTSKRHSLPPPTHDLPALTASLARFTQLISSLTPRLDAHLAQLEAATNGLVLQVHSASELQAKLAQATAERRLAVLDFTAVWCGPCKAVAPVLGQLSGEWAAQAMFVKVDVDELEEVAAEYGVTAMPTFVFVREGKEVEKTRIQGANVPALKRALVLLTPDEAEEPPVS